MDNCYNSDSGVFVLYQFRSDCQGKKQTQYFSGVGAKHQNGKADRAIKTIIYWYRNMMTNESLNWPVDNADSVQLWSFTVTHVAWLYNHLPNKHLGWMSPVGQEAAQNCFHGGTIFQGTASNIVHVQHQVSFVEGEKVIGKAQFEDWIYNLAVIMAKRYHSDNGVFISDHFRSDCQGKKQTQYFSGVGAKHQNVKLREQFKLLSIGTRKGA